MRDNLIQRHDYQWRVPWAGQAGIWQLKNKLQTDEMMNLTTAEIKLIFKDWLKAWNEHDIKGVLSLFHDDIIFENFTGIKIVGKKMLQRSWSPWFLNHGNFKFLEEDIFFDENEQKMLFMWKLEWPSLIESYLGKLEIRRGVDILYFENGKIIQKLSYSKTTIQIEGSLVSL